MTKKWRTDMRSIFLIGSLAVTLGGCQTAGTAISGAVTSVTTIANQVIAQTKLVCGKEPLVADIIQMVNVFVPGVDSVAEVADSLCGAFAGTTSAKPLSAMATLAPIATQKAATVIFHEQTFKVHWKLAKP